uniref:Ubiquitinyl hydrolase 1 n=1 Tax=Parascaris univalens TaxID=6257 RepID=A0A915CHN6_PARUN
MATLSELITARDDTPPPSQQQGTPHHPGSGFQSGVIPPHLMRSSQGSPGVDRMPQLKQLVLSADEDVTTSSSMRTAEECVDELLAESAPPDSALGQAVDNLFVSWNQLVLDLSARSGFTPPSLEHIKEVAECAIRQVSDIDSQWFLHLQVESLSSLVILISDG